MNQRFLLAVLLLFFAYLPVAADVPSLLKIFRRVSPVEVNESKSYALAETDGPWLILASTQVGEGAKQRAERLAIEIRRELRLPAFVYQETFDFTGAVDGSSGSSKRLRYANQYRYDAYAVLVGEYDTINHPGVERDLKRIHLANLPIFRDKKPEAAKSGYMSPIERVKDLTAEMLRKRTDKKLGPMGNAFVTRNPLLPQEYFDTPQVDSFVHQLNDGVPFSLLKSDGKYTVVVKTFEGQRTIVDGKHDKNFKPRIDRLDRNAENANRMTNALRKQGVEAYQFHDRFRSLVTVGSFESLGREFGDGKFEYAPQIRRVMKKYSAMNVDPRLARQVPAGSDSMAANSAALIPFDVQPTPIVVPQVSKRSLYGARLGLK